MSASKKPSALVSDPFARRVLDSVSKAALLDLVADLLRRNAGDETLDGEPLALAFEEAMEPIARMRRDPWPIVQRVKTHAARKDAANERARQSAQAERDRRAKGGVS